MKHCTNTEIYPTTVGLLSAVVVVATLVHGMVGLSAVAAQGFASPVSPSSSAQAPSVQWASRLARISSQLQPSGAYSAEQLLGKPNMRSHAGETNPCSWASGKDVHKFPVSITDNLRVGFAVPVVARQVAVAENWHPGAITAIIIYGEQGERDTVYKALPQELQQAWRMFNVIFAPRAFKVSEVEVVLNVGLTPGQNEIDAIALGTGTDSIRADINVVPGMPVSIPMENLGSAVNSEAKELFPIIAPDGKTLYFCRKHHPQNIGAQKAEDIWFAERIDTAADGTTLPKPRWGQALPLGEPLNNAEPNFACAILPDGNTMLVANVYLPGGRMAAGVSMSYRTTTGWSQPVKQVIQDFQTKQFASYSLGSDGKTLLMALERVPSFGGLDLYVSFLQPDGKWSAPRNLGADINTAGDEGTAFLASDGKTLYFSSDGHNGYGSNDIFITRRLDSTWTRWSEPQNLGPAVNTDDWDAYFSLPASGEYAYFVSEKNSFGGSDIFRIPVPEVLRPRPVVLISGKTINAKTQKPIGALIRYELLSSSSQLGKELGIARSDSLTGRYSITLPAGEIYGFRAEADGFIAISENLDLRSVTQYREQKRDLRLVKAAKGESVLMNNIFFATNKADLEVASEPELMRIVAMLKENPAMMITIAGHTDNTGSAKTNLALSHKRAQAVADFLMQQGIAGKRLAVKGFAAEKPIASNDREEGRQQNRRVEFVIDEN